MHIVLIHRASTLFLKVALVTIAAAVLVLCVFAFPFVYMELRQGLPTFAFAIYLALIGLILSPFPFFFALYQAFMLLQYIDTNNAFSEASIRSLGYIKYCAIAMSVLYAMCIPLAVVIAELDDAPGAVVIGCVIACAPLVVATFAAVLQKLVHSAVTIKTENEFTI